jgi:hypothetical protein
MIKFEFICTDDHESSQHFASRLADYTDLQKYKIQRKTILNNKLCVLLSRRT